MLQNACDSAQTSPNGQRPRDRYLKEEPWRGFAIYLLVRSSREVLRSVHDCIGTCSCAL